MKSIKMALSLALGAGLIMSGCSSGNVNAGAPEALPIVPLTVQSGTKKHMFKVEVARTADEQARGLMFRQTLGPDRGMIFPMIPPREASFWMKNTLIPLDIIFVRTDGSIARIEPETTPHSLEPVTSGEPVGAVLEIAGGLSAKLGIAEGDQISWPNP